MVSGVAGLGAAAWIRFNLGGTTNGVPLDQLLPTDNSSYLINKLQNEVLIGYSQELEEAARNTTADSKWEDVTNALRKDLRKHCADMNVTARPSLYSNAFSFDGKQFLELRKDLGAPWPAIHRKPGRIIEMAGPFHHDGSTAGHTVWVPIINDVTQWPIVVIDPASLKSCEKTPITPKCWPHKPATPRLLYSQPRLGEYLMWPGDVFHASGEVIGLSPDTPRNALSYDVRCVLPDSTEL